MRSSERAECIKSLVRLRQQEEVIEKALDNYLDSAKLEPETLKGLRDEKHSCTLDRKKWAISLRATVQDIANDLRAIKAVIRTLHDGHKIDTDGFKDKLIALAEKIREYKKNSLLESLTSEEIELDRELHSFSLILHKYEKRDCTAGSLIASREPSKTKNSGTDFQDYSGLRDFNALVARTGHTENWSDEDHRFFLKIRKTTRGVPAMVEAIRKKFPDMSTERIVNHEAWYKIYLELREKQRRTVREWREKRDSEKRTRIDRADGDVSCANANEKTCERVATAKEADSAEITAKTRARLAARKSPSACDKRESLNRWRVEKEKARSLQAERTKLANEEREARSESRRLARAEQLKSALEAYREKKIQSKTSSSATSVADSDSGNSRAEAAKMIECFRRRDEEFLGRRRALLQSKAPHSSATERRRMHLQSERKSTLLRATKVWLEKCKDRAVEPQQILFVKDIPKLATCNWHNREST